MFPFTYVQRDLTHLKYIFISTSIHQILRKETLHSGVKVIRMHHSSVGIYIWICIKSDLLNIIHFHLLFQIQKPFFVFLVLLFLEYWNSLNRPEKRTDNAIEWPECIKIASTVF